jgi:hypothetical protein
MPLLSDPLETIVRNVLIIPADGAKAHIVPKTFSEAASKARSDSIFTRIVDLRGHYGYRKHIETTHYKLINIARPSSVNRKVNKEQFIMYSNIAPELPINRSAARMLGIDPSALERTLFYRGDLVIVKSEDCPGQQAGLLLGRVHKNYRDVDLSFQSAAEIEHVVKEAYNTEELRLWMTVMAYGALRSVQTGKSISHSQLQSYSQMEGLHLSDRYVRFGLQMQSEPIDISQRSE